MSSSANLRLSYYNSLQAPVSSSATSQPTASLTPSPSPSSPPSSRRVHIHSHSHSRPPQSQHDSSRVERKAHAKKLLKKYPVISPESFGRVSKFCPICLDLLTSATITKTACNHYLHRSCLLKRLSDDPAAACPSCRVSVKAPRGSGSAKKSRKLDKGCKTASLQHLGGGLGAPLAGLGPIETFP